MLVQCSAKCQGRKFLNTQWNIWPKLVERLSASSLTNQTPARRLSVQDQQISMESTSAALRGKLYIAPQKRLRWQVLALL